MKPVPVRMVLPITFKLGDNESPDKAESVEQEDDKLSAAPENIDEVVLVGYINEK